MKHVCVVHCACHILSVVVDVAVVIIVVVIIVSVIVVVVVIIIIIINISSSSSGDIQIRETKDTVRVCGWNSSRSAVSVALRMALLVDFGREGYGKSSCSRSERSHQYFRTLLLVFAY